MLRRGAAAWDPSQRVYRVLLCHMESYRVIWPVSLESSPVLVARVIRHVLMTIQPNIKTGACSNNHTSPGEMKKAGAITDPG